MGIKRPVTESEMDGLRDIESIDLERVRILGMYAVGGRAGMVSRFEVEAADRWRVGERSTLGLPSIVASALSLPPKWTRGVSSLEEDEEVDLVVACLAGVSGWEGESVPRILR
jgi:hypothetical protein